MKKWECQSFRPVGTAVFDILPHKFSMKIANLPDYIIFAIWYLLNPWSDFRHIHINGKAFRLSSNLSKIVWAVREIEPLQLVNLAVKLHFFVITSGPLIMRPNFKPFCCQNLKFLGIIYLSGICGIGNALIWAYQLHLKTNLWLWNSYVQKMSSIWVWRTCLITAN